MNCSNCGTTIWICASCQGACPTPACGACLEAGHVDRHERVVVALPELDASSYEWLG